tara:strand:+ start:276 stop:500 length:225 start_codon:yes stop_codon:yes gene_type:complete
MRVIHVPVGNTTTKTDKYYPYLAKHVPMENTATKSDNSLAKHVTVENTTTNADNLVVQHVPVLKAALLVPPVVQ